MLTRDVRHDFPSQDVRRCVVKSFSHDEALDNLVGSECVILDAVEGACRSVVDLKRAYIGPQEAAVEGEKSCFAKSELAH